jgi:D-arginine dehydrogenase
VRSDPLLVDVLVVGAGIVGLSIAAELSAARRVALIDSETEVAQHATGRSVSVSIPWYGNKDSQVFTKLSRDWFAAASAKTNGKSFINPRGLMTVGLVGDTDRQDANDLQSETDRMTAREAANRIPILRESLIESASYDPSVVDIDVARMLKHYLQVLSSNKGQLLTSHRLINGSWGPRAWSVTTSQNTIECDLIVNAGGAWADIVASALGAHPIGLQPLKRTVTEFADVLSASATTWPLVLDKAGTLYFKPHGTRLISSSNEEIPWPAEDALASSADVFRNVDRMKRFTTLDTTRVSRSWAGLRTFSPDRSLVLGPDPDIATLIWCAGQGGAGVQSAPAVAEAVVSLMDADELPRTVLEAGISKMSLSPARFSRTPNPSPHSGMGEQQT